MFKAIEERGRGIMSSMGAGRRVTGRAVLQLTQRRFRSILLNPGVIPDGALVFDLLDPQGNVAWSGIPADGDAWAYDSWEDARRWVFGAVSQTLSACLEQGSRGDTAPLVSLVESLRLDVRSDATIPAGEVELSLEIAPPEGQELEAPPSASASLLN